MLNKVILLGRLTKDPEVRYHQSSKSGETFAVARYTLAVDRDFKRDGEPTADFITCSTLGKRAEFVEKYLKKGQLISVCGRLQVRTWDDQNGQRHWSTEVQVEEHHFAESKASFEANRNQSSFDSPNKPPENSFNSAPKPSEPEGFYAIDESLDDEDLPF